MSAINSNSTRLSNDRQIRVGLIGYGMAGRRFHAPLLQAEPRMVLAAVNTSRKDQVRDDWPGVATTLDSQSLFADHDIDLVVIASPNDTHASLAASAIQAGKHVVIDKPFATTVSEARQLQRLAEQHGVLLSVFHNRRWDSDFLTVARAIREGRIGEVSHFESRFEVLVPLNPGEWRDQQGDGAGIWMDIGSHLVDQALLLFGKPDSLSADFATQRGGTACDWANVILHYGGIRVVLHMSLSAPATAGRFIAHGSQGTLIKLGRDQQGRQLLAGVKPGGTDWGRDTDPLSIIDRAGNRTEIEAETGDQRAYYKLLSAALIDKGNNPVPPEQALEVMDVLQQARSDWMAGLK